MPKVKTAITVPERLLAEIDEAAQARGESRSAYVVRILSAAVQARRDADITARLNLLFEDSSAAADQISMAAEADAAGTSWDDESW